MASELRIDDDAAETATHSVSLHRGLQQVIAEREADIVDEMVLNYRGGKASHEYVIAKVAAISELRRLEASLDRQARLSIEKATAGVPT